MDYAIGIDIGSTCAKTAVLAADGSFALLSARPTGWSSVDTAEAIRAELEAAHFSPETYPCVATGYGRVAVPYAGKSVTEITCHARGACFLHGRDDLLVIDIGGQDTKVIGVSGGAVQDFLMNDKCSAGTGRFLEIMANRLGMRPEELCALAARGGGASISSICTVFAESEVVSLIGQGAPREDIAYAVVDSIAGKVAARRSTCPTPLPKSSARRSSRIRRGALPGPSARRSPRAGFPDNKETRSYMHGALSSRNI